MKKRQHAADTPFVILPGSISSTQTVSDPQSAKYGQFIDEKALSALTAPPQAHVATVKHWLEANKVDQYEITNEWVVFQTDVSTAETMLDTTFNWYKHSSANDENERSRLALRTLGYSVPSSISNVISMIQPTTRFGQPQPKANMLLSNPELSRFTALDNAASANSATVPSDCVYNNITASCLRQYYGVDNFHANPNVSSLPCIVTAAPFIAQVLTFNMTRTTSDRRKGLFRILPRGVRTLRRPPVVRAGVRPQCSRTELCRRADQRRSQ